MQMCKLDFENVCFSHRRLSVFCSYIIGKPQDLLIYTDNGKIKNIVYKLIP